MDERTPLSPYPASLARDRRCWRFAGRDEWLEDADGTIRSPTWTRATADLLAYWPRETDDRQRQDFAFLAVPLLDDVDVSVDVKLYLQTTCCQVVFRARDSRQFYELEIRHLFEKGTCELTFLLQDAEGFRRRLGHGLAGTIDLLRADTQRPTWMTVRVRACGPELQAWLDGALVVSVRDGTYADGAVGIGSLGRIEFRNLRVRGHASRRSRGWRMVDGETPSFTYPYASDTIDLANPTVPFMGWPSGVVRRDGEVLLFRDILPGGIVDEGRGTAIVRSRDHGRTWGAETRIDGIALNLPFEHADGSLSALASATYDGEGRRLGKLTPAIYKAADEGAITIRRECLVARSRDGGRTWDAPRPIVAASRPLADWGNFWIYSGFRRLSDGSLLMTPYGGRTENTPKEQRLNQTFAMRSENDGATWSAPEPVETTHHDTNEGAAAELANGDLLIFMRSVRSPYLWRARSTDKGRTWQPIEPTDITLDCPQFLRTRDGILVLQTRGGALQYSTDDGASWSPLWSIGRFVHMGCLLETADGALLAAHLDAGFADITKVRATRFRVSPEGVVPAE